MEWSMSLGVLASIIGLGITILGIIGKFFWTASQHSSRIKSNAEKIKVLEIAHDKMINSQKSITDISHERDTKQDRQMNQVETSLAVISANQEQFTNQMLKLITKQDSRLDQMDSVITDLKDLTIRLDERVPSS